MAINFTEIVKEMNFIDPSSKKEEIYYFSTTTKEQQAKFISVTAKVIDACPKGHSGEGKPGWLFADELMVE